MSRIHLSLPNAYTLMCFDRNINGNRDVKFWIGIIGHCTDERNLLYQTSIFLQEGSRIKTMFVPITSALTRWGQMFVRII